MLYTLPNSLVVVMYVEFRRQCDTAQGDVEASIDCRSPLMALSWHPKHAVIAIAPDSSAGDAGGGGGGRGSVADKYMRLITFSGGQ
jgi:hypothetical protein